MKIMKPTVSQEDFEKEAENMAKLAGSKDMINFYGICQESTPFWLVLEFMDKGALDKYLEQHQLTPRQKVEIMYQVCAYKSFS